MKLSIIIKYFLISGSIVVISFLSNYFLTIILGININISFIFLFITFNYLSYFFNSKYNFKKKITFKKYLIYIQNTIFTLISCLIIINFLKYYFLISDLYNILTGIIYSSFLNFFLNLKRTFNNLE